MAEKKRATRKDVASMAGVSDAVVSYVINNSNYVSAEKRTLVLEAIEKLGYEPNFYARSLKLRRSESIGVIVSAMMNENLFEAIFNIEKVATDKKYTISVTQTKKLSDEIIDTFRQKCDGIIVICDRLCEEELDLLNKHALKKTPILVVAYHSIGKLNRKISLVNIKPEKGIDTLLDSFQKHNVKSISYLTSETEMDISTSKGKYIASLESAKRHDMSLDVLSLNINSPGKTEEELQRLIEGNKLPDAILAENSKMAMFFLGYAANKGILVPEDVMLAGFGDSSLARAFNPSLTVINYDKESAYTLLTKKMIKQIEAGEVFKTEIESQVVFRQSTKV